MPVNIDFQSTKLGGGEGEDAFLGLADGRLVTVLVRVVEGGEPAEAAPYYLETGFSPCDSEGVLFATLADAETWMRAQIASFDQRRVEEGSRPAVNHRA